MTKTPISGITGFFMLILPFRKTLDAAELYS